MKIFRFNSDTNLTFLLLIVLLTVVTCGVSIVCNITSEEAHSRLEASEVSSDPNSDYVLVPNEPNDDWYMSAITMDDVNADDVLVFTDSDIDLVFDSNSVWTAAYDLPPGDVVNLVIIAENGDEVLITVDVNGIDVVGATREGARIFFEEYLKPIADEYIRANCEN